MRTLRSVQVFSFFFALTLLGAFGPLARGQGVAQALVASGATASETAVSDALLALPDAPSSVRSSVSSSEDGAATVAPVAGFGFDPVRQQSEASATDSLILPGQSAPRLTAHDKVAMGVKSAVSPFTMMGWVASALYEQAFDGAPNYGSDGKAFAQRLGAAAARSASENIISKAVMAPILHEDPRYYKMGRGHNVLKRGVYAATRTIITRTDEGGATPNFALLAGNLAGSVLTNAYYPRSNRTVGQTAKTFVGSVGGSALGFAISEFLSDTLAMVHLKKTE